MKKTRKEKKKQQQQQITHKQTQTKPPKTNMETQQQNASILTQNGKRESFLNRTGVFLTDWCFLICCSVFDFLMRLAFP